MAFSTVIPVGGHLFFNFILYTTFFTMLEIIALYFLCKQMGQLARQKGQPAGKWKFYTIAGWFIAEILGFIMGVSFFGPSNLIGLMLIGLISAVGGYLIVKAQLEKYPDEMEDDIEQIGN
jgi:hypothetical protein